MTPAFSARRRADEFEALLSRPSDAPLTERDAARFAELLDVVSDLRTLPPVAARPEFVASLREQLMAEADTALVPQPLTPARLAMPITSRPRQRRVAVLLGGAALAGAATTMAVAAQTALPGESLYAVKRGLESAELRFASDDAARGRALLAQAARRLTELEELAAGDARGRDELVPDTLDTFTRQSTDGVSSLLASYDATGQQRDAQHARDFTTASLQRLDELEEQLPESARDELLAAGRTLTDLDYDVSAACPTCSGGVTTTPDFLLTSAPADLLAGLDSDELTLEAAGAPISGQDLTGIEVPEVLQSPTAAPTSSLPTAVPSVRPTQTPTATPTKGVDKVTDPVKEGVKEGVKGVTEGVTGVTSDVASQLNGVTGGAIGGLASGLDDATGGLIGEVTGTLDGLTGGTATNATGGVLP
jgi:hypothetical protein